MTDHGVEQPDKGNHAAGDRVQIAGGGQAGSVRHHLQQHGARGQPIAESNPISASAPLLLPCAVGQHGQIEKTQQVNGVVVLDHPKELAHPQTQGLEDRHEYQRGQNQVA